jgi:chemotaxis protein MotB
MRRRRRVEHHANTERWLISYADFITLLFAFFVTMYAISTVDQRKLQKAVAAFQVAFADSRQTAADLATQPTAAATAAAAAAGDGVLAQVETRLMARLNQIGESRVQVARDQRGLVVSVREAGNFPIGSAELNAEAVRLFHEIGASLTGIPNHVRVEGHTDDVPIHTPRYASNWELSTARATAVVAYFVQDVGLAPDRLSAAGYAEFHPRTANDSAEQRAENRRVDIVVLNPQTRDREEPRGSAGTVR